MSLRRRALFLAGLFVAVSCSDAGNPLEPGRPTPQPKPVDALQVLQCSLNVPTASLRCELPQPDAGGALAAGQMITGGQNKYVTLAASNFAHAAGSMEFDVTVKSLMRQALGTEDGTTLHADGVRVWFADDPVAQPTGSVSADALASGTGILITNPQPYFQYDTILRTDETSDPRRWRFDFTGTPTNILFKVYVVAQVQYPTGWIEISPSGPDTLAPTETLQLSAVAYASRADTAKVSQGVAWSSSDPDVATVNSSGLVTGVQAGTAVIKATSTILPVNSDSTPAPDSVVIVVNTAPSFVVDTFPAISNVTIPQPASEGLLKNVSDPDGQTIAIVPDTVTTAEGGTAWINADGSLEYLSKAGFVGTDSVPFEFDDGVSRWPGHAIVEVAASNYWYVQPGGTGDGRDRFPLGSMAQAQDSATAGDTILVLTNGVQQLDGPVTLEAGQAILGQGITSSVTRTVNGQTVTILAAGSATSLTNTAAGHTVTLGTDNTIRGIGITAGAGAAIAGTGFGTLFVREVDVNPAGPALLLSTGALDAVFGTLSSTGSGTTGVSLTAVTGSLTGTAGTIGNATGTAFHVSGGSADISYGGAINNTAGAAVDVSGRTGGTLTLSGSITDTGTGISVTGNSGGTVELTGASKSITTGAAAGVTVTGNTGATVRFAGGELDVTTTSGAGFTASGGGTVMVTGAGNSVASTTGTAVTLNGVDAGVSGITFAAVSANGAVNGIKLTNVTGAGFQARGGTIQNTTGHGIELSSMGLTPVQLESVSVSGTISGGNAGIFAANSDSLQVTGVTVNVTGGPALSLSDGGITGTAGAATGTFATLSSTTSAGNGVILSNMQGSLSAAAGSISNAASTGYAIVGGGVGSNYQGDISQTANNAALVAVSGGHTGVGGFSGGTLNATTGTGIQFNDADGSYSFAGTTTLNGGDAGVDITNGSDGAIALGAGVSVTNPTGPALAVNGSSPTLTYSGSLTKENAGLLVEVAEQPGGSLLFTGTLNATAGDGISFSNADGTADFNGTTTLNGGNARLSVVNGSSGAITFLNTTSISSGTTTALHVANAGQPVNLAYGGTINTSLLGRPAHVEGVSGGTLLVSGNITSTGQGIEVVNNTGGTIAFDGASKSLSTGSNPAVTATGNTGATLRFGGGGLGITTTTGAGLSASAGGTVSVTGAGNTIATTTGTALSLASVSTGVSGVNLAGVSANGAVNGIVLSSLTGSGVQVNGGTVQATTGPAVSLTSLAGLGSHVELAGMTLSRAAGTGAVVSGTSFGTLALGGSSVSATGGPAAMNLTTGSLSGTIASISASGVAAGTHAVSLSGVGGTYTVTGGTVNGTTSGDALRVSGGNAVAAWNNTLAATLAGGRSVNIASTTGGSHTFANTVTAGNGSAGVAITGNAGSVTMPGLTLGTSVQRFGATPLTLQMGSGNVNLGAVSIFTTGASATGLAMTTAAGAGTLTVASGTIDAAGSPAVHIVPSSGTQPVSIALTTVNANGGANGIALGNTSGTFAVNGSGGTCTVATPTCTGGHIQSTMGSGVSLSSTGAVTLTRLRVRASGQHGVHATGSTNLTLNSSYLQGNGNGDEENGLNLLNASGTVLVDASSFNGAAENLIRVDNNNANLTFTVQNASSFEFPNPEPSPFRNSAILITPKGSSAITATVTGNTFRNIPVSSFQFAPDASVTATGNATFTNNTLSADVGLNVTCASNSQCRVGNVVAGGTGGITNFVASGNNFNRINGDGVFILGANQSSTLRTRIESNTISNALDDAFVVGLGQSARVIAQFNGNTISNIGADVLEVASGETNAAFGAGAASDMDLVFTNNSMNTVGTNASLAGTGGPGVFRFGDADQLLCLAFTGNSMSGPLPTTGLKVYLDGNFGALGGSMTYEGAGIGALTDAKIQADNPGMSLAPANTVISAVNLSNGATCQRPGI